jgi:hypothetical protein
MKSEFDKLFQIFQIRDQEGEGGEIHTYGYSHNLSLHMDFAFLFRGDFSVLYLYFSFRKN